MIIIESMAMLKLFIIRKNIIMAKKLIFAVYSAHFCHENQSNAEFNVMALFNITSVSLWLDVDKIGML